jgi:scyllo-inositol 2-dehydrogenase (NADP+)
MQKIKTALCSFGMSGRVFHAPFIQLHQGFELVGAWERTSNLVQQYYPNAKSYDTFEELLNDDIDLVIINTPTNTHYEFAKEALMNDKHIVVEKAFTTTVGEANGLQFLAEQVDKKLAVFQNRRWDSDFKTVQKIVADNVLGDLCEAEFSFNRFNLELSPKKHKEMPGAGAGIVNDLGPHLIDQALCLFGMPQKLFADIRHTRPTTKVDDCFEIILYYASFRVRLKAGYIVQKPLPAYILHGTNGSFIKPRGDVQETLLQQNKKPNTTHWAVEDKENYGTLHQTKNGKLVEEKIKSLSGNYYHFYDEVYTSIINNTPTPVTAQDGLNIMKIIEAAVLSNKEERVVVLN